MNLGKQAEKVLELLKPNQKKVISKRFGLFGNKKATLAKIGGEMDRTRERVRQIEASGLSELQKPETQTLIADTQKKVGQAVSQLGGVVVESQIAPIVLKDSSDQTKENINALMLLVTILPNIERTRKNQHFNRYWFKQDYTKKEIDNVADAYEKMLKKLKKPVVFEQLIKELDKNIISKFNSQALGQIFNIKKALGKDKKNRAGLMSWYQVNPKSARDKAYLILKQVNKPLHYTEIAERIAQENFYSKHNPTAPTVHNEVILDDRFVLIGRGIYALKEWGYSAGTVSDVITGLLKKTQKALGREEIIDQVIKQRQVARNTVLANLNRKDSFKKVGKDKYQLTR